MIKKLRFFFTLMLLFVGIGSALAQTTVTFDATSDKGTSLTEVSKGSVTITVGQGALNNGTDYRFYKGQTVTINSTSGNIIKVVFTCTKKGTAKYGPGCFANASTGTYTASDAETGTWEGSATEFKIKASSNQVRCTKIEVTIAPAGETKEATTVSFDTPSYTFTQNSTEAKNFVGQKATVTASDGTVLSNAALTYTVSPESLAIVDNDGTVALDETKVGVVTVTATYAGDDDYYGSNASYTITIIEPKTTGDGTEANPYTVADMQLLNTKGTLPTSDVYVKGIVASVNSYNNKYGSLTYSISDDGTKTDTLLVYGGLGLNSAKFTGLSDLSAGNTVILNSATNCVILY